MGVVDCTSPEPLADEILRLLADNTRREQMGRDARDWAVSRFDWSALAQQTADLFGVDIREFDSSTSPVEDPLEAN